MCNNGAPFSACLTFSGYATLLEVAKELGVEQHLRLHIDDAVQFREHSLDLGVAEVSRGMQVPCLEKKVFPAADRLANHTRVPPIIFSCIVSVLRKNVLDALI